MSQGQALGAKVRAVRRHANLSQPQLAAKLGISTSYLNLIEHDRRPLSAALLIRLADTLDVDIKTFSTDHDVRLVSDSDDVGEFNGPLWFIRGSHRHGPAPAGLDTVTTSYALWTVPNDTVARLANDGGIVSAHGPAGTGLIFGDLMVHGSPANMSPWDRRIFSLILNPVANRQTTFKRPDHQHHRDFSPVVPLRPSKRSSAASMSAGTPTQGSTGLPANSCIAPIV